MPLIKVAYLMLNFLNLKSFLSNLFFVVASSLSTLWSVFFSDKSSTVLKINILSMYRLKNCFPCDGGFC